MTKLYDRQAELDVLAGLPDQSIDTTDIPEARAGNWRSVHRGARAPKQSVTIRLDLIVLKWFKERAPSGGYQSAINDALRMHIANDPPEGADIRLVHSTVQARGLLREPKLNCRMSNNRERKPPLIARQLAIRGSVQGLRA